MRISHRVGILVVGFSLALTACSGNGTNSNANPATDGGNQAGSGKDGFTGTVTTSGLYEATWSASADAELGPFNSVSSVILTSNKQTFGHIDVKPDGTVHFGSAAPEFGHSIAFAGSGAKVTLDSGSTLVCAFTVDTDLTDESTHATVHLSGGMSVNWHPEGIGDIKCP